MPRARFARPERVANFVSAHAVQHALVKGCLYEKASPGTVLRRVDRFLHGATKPT
jgi:hypothetical protein